jgi:hypothetical protein
VPKIMLNCGPNGRRWLGIPLNRLLDEAETCLSRPISGRLMMVIMMMIQLFKTTISQKASIQRQGDCCSVTCNCHSFAELQKLPTAMQISGWVGNGSKRAKTWSI